MKLEKLKFQKELGWDKHLPVHLDSERSLILVFGGRDHFDYHYPFENLKEHFPKSQIIGCSGSAAIYDTSYTQEDLIAIVIEFETGRIRRAATSVEFAEGSYHAGLDIGRFLDAPDLRGIVVLTDGINVDTRDLLEGLNESVKSNAVIFGGVAADDDRYELTWVLENGIPRESVISAIGIYGEGIHISCSSQDGLDFFGIERKVTRSYKNQVYELDGFPALSIYKKLLGEKANELPDSAICFPLSVSKKSGSSKRIVKSVLRINEADQSLSFAGEIPEGYFVRLMRATSDRVIDGADAAARLVARDLSDSTPVACLAISYAARRHMLGERTGEELEAVFRNLPFGSKMVGFYSFGEISPILTGKSELHNQTIGLTTIFED